MVLNEEQRMVRDSAREFVRAKAPVSALRALRGGAEPKGYSPALWKEMTEMGWAGVLIPEEYGGIGMGFQALCLVLEETGATLAASPLVSTALTGACALLLGGSEAHKQALLPRIASGDLIMALALEEGAHHAPEKTALRADRAGGGYSLSGKKTFVLDGHAADKLIVVARTDGVPGERDGLTLFLVDGDAPGITRTRTIMVDSRNAAQISFNGVSAGEDAVLGEVGNGFALLDAVLDRARIGLACEMLGSAQGAFDMTLGYLKERTQFGSVIGRFQALQHRAAQMFSELELTRAVTLAASSAVDETPGDVPQLASLAKARAGDTFHLVAREGIQMHGGIGMTDEHDIGFYLKRCAVAEQTFGSPAFHRSRYAELEGF